MNYYSDCAKFVEGQNTPYFAQCEATKFDSSLNRKGGVKVAHAVPLYLIDSLLPGSFGSLAF